MLQEEENAFQCIDDTFTGGNIINEAPWQMKFAHDVVQCARDTHMPELEMEQWREVGGENGNESVKIMERH